METDLAEAKSLRVEDQDQDNVPVFPPLKQNMFDPYLQLIHPLSQVPPKQLGIHRKHIRNHKNAQL